jgi:predicted anti-sigma-YlaC factor YlaD
MECITCQELFSASLDGEVTVDELAAVSRHLEQCRSCRAFAEEAQVLHRQVRASHARAVPDLTARLVATSAPEAPSDRRLRMLRGVLLLVAAAQLALAIPVFLSGDVHGMPLHHTRHMGALQLALAVGFASVAVRPRIAVAGFLPLATALVVMGSALAIADTLSGHTTATHEATHLAALVGLAAAWLIGASFRPRPLRPSRRHGRLEVVA